MPDHLARVVRAGALACALAAPARADVVPALGAGTSVMVVDEEALGTRVSLGAAFAGEVALPVRGTRWSVVPSITLGVRVGTQPVIGTLAEVIAIARRIGPVSARFGLGPTQMIVEDSGRARLVDRGLAVCAIVSYHPRADLALVVSVGQGRFDEVTITTSTVGAAWTP